MDHTGKAQAIVVEALASVRDQARKALEEQRFGEVVEIARLADALAALIDRDATSEPAQDHSSKPARAPGRPGGMAKRGQYPRFSRDGDKLCKVGWSKKSRAEYEHRAPLAVVEQLILAIKKKVVEGEQFTVIDVFPVKDTTGGTFPDYQGYVALKWLHTEGLVTKHGRDRYSIEPGRLADDTLERLWAALPQFNGALR